MSGRHSSNSSLPEVQAAQAHTRPATALLIIVACAGLVFLGLLALGTWQIKRLQWKLDLIERVEQRVHAAPVPAPGPDRWTQIQAATDEYRHVLVSGSFLYAQTVRVQASTVLGGGFWLLTPLQQTDGTIVLINRGFVPAKTPETSDLLVPGGSVQTVVTGLLRISEPGGGFLRKNDPVQKRWYSRDVQAIAAAQHLGSDAVVAPYFIDADAATTGAETANADRPVAGLTVISFPNNHLVYALTWYALALMVAAACFWLLREERLRAGKAEEKSLNRESHDGDTK